MESEGNTTNAEKTDIASTGGCEMFIVGSDDEDVASQKQYIDAPPRYEPWFENGVYNAFLHIESIRQHAAIQARCPCKCCSH